MLAEVKGTEGQSPREGSFFVRRQGVSRMFLLATQPSGPADTRKGDDRRHDGHANQAEPERSRFHALTLTVAAVALAGLHEFTLGHTRLLKKAPPQHRLRTTGAQLMHAPAMPLSNLCSVTPAGFPATPSPAALSSQSPLRRAWRSTPEVVIRRNRRWRPTRAAPPCFQLCTLVHPLTGRTAAAASGAGRADHMTLRSPS